MPTYTVHEPPPRKGESTTDPVRFVFVRDGFHFWAFALALAWLLVHRLWLVLVGYLIFNVLLGIALFFARVPEGAEFIISFLVALLIGFEAASLWRWTLTRRRYRQVGFVVGDDAETAERRFFAAWAERKGEPTPSAREPVYTTPVRRGPPTGADVIGLFPEPGGSR